MSATKARRVTIINDSIEFVEVVREALHDENCMLTGFTAVDVRFEEVVDSRPELLIIDLVLGDRRQELSGWELMLMARAHRHLRHVPIILCSADIVALRERADELAEMAGVHVLEKPFRLDDLGALVNRLLTP